MAKPSTAAVTSSSVALTRVLSIRRLRLLGRGGATRSWSHPGGAAGGLILPLPALLQAITGEPPSVEGDGSAGGWCDGAGGGTYAGSDILRLSDGEVLRPPGGAIAGTMLLPISSSGGFSPPGSKSSGAATSGANVDEGKGLACPSAR